MPQQNGTAPETIDTEVMSDDHQGPGIHMPENEFRAGVERLMTVIQDGFEKLNRTLEGTYVREDVQGLKNTDFDKRIGRLERAGAWLVGLLVVAIIGAVLRLVIVGA